MNGEASGRAGGLMRAVRERAAGIAGVRGRAEAASIADQLLQIADGIDSSELPALSDAVEAPGEAAYSPAAIERFALLAGELRRLRTCEAEDCEDVHVDLSRNRSRRFCSTTCGNRMAAAAYRERQAAGGDD